MNWCDSTPESSHAVAEFAHRQTENGIIHETGHAVYFRLVERMSATTPASRQLRDQWDAFSWNPRTGNQDTMGSPTHSSRIPIPRSCVRNPAPRVAPPVTSCTTAGLQTRMNSDSREADARSAGFVSIHAAINNVEDFAEAYAQYFTGLRPITDSPEGRAILRRKFAFIESLIGVPRPAGLPNP